MKLLVSLVLMALPFAAAGPVYRGYSPAASDRQRQLEEKLRSIPEPHRVREHIRRMSEEPHHAGSPGSKRVAEYVLAQFREFGLDARIEEFEALLPYPRRRTLEMTEPHAFTAKMQEPQIAEDKDSGDADQLPTFNGYSGDGDVTAPVVYVNYGIPADYEQLKKLGIDPRGKIVVARYGASWRGTKAKVAAEHGAVGVLIYSDPKEDGYYAGDAYPKGAYRPRDGVQRGSVMDMPIYPGDPLSPGWASEKGSKRLSIAESRTIMKIPVLPISYSDALPILESLGGPVVPDGWKGALPITYHAGPGPATVHLKVEHDWSTRPIFNVVARIPGSELPDQWVLYGNHHDAWVNGAADPCSGAAALLETARAVGQLLKEGWKPRRTILFAVWDAEEYGLIGSTEWVEKYAAELDRKAVVYLNTDMNTKGTFGVGGSQVLEQFMADVLGGIGAPGKDKSLLAAAEEKKDKDGRPLPFRVEAAGSGSDYTAFLHHLGVSSLNLGFSDGAAAGIYHSIYDSFDWYNRFADRDYMYGRALAQITSTAIVRMADAPLLPFEFPRMAKTVSEYVEELGKIKGGEKLQLGGLRREAGLLVREAKSCETRYQQAAGRLGRSSPERLAHANELLFRTERTFLRAQGLPGREWMKNQIYAPGAYTGYSAKTLPGVREAAEAANWDEANRQAELLAGVLRAIRAHMQETERALSRL